VPNCDGSTAPRPRSTPTRSTSFAKRAVTFDTHFRVRVRVFSLPSHAARQRPAPAVSLVHRSWARASRFEHSCPGAGGTKQDIHIASLTDHSCITSSMLLGLITGPRALFAPGTSFAGRVPTREAMVSRPSRACARNSAEALSDGQTWTNGCSAINPIHAEARSLPAPLLRSSFRSGSTSRREDWVPDAGCFDPHEPSRRRALPRTYLTGWTGGVL